RTHSLHRDIGVENVFDSAAATAWRFDAQAIIRVFEGTIPHGNIPDAADGLTSNRNTMPVFECAALDHDAFTSKLASLNFLAGFDRHIVISNINETVGNQHIA